MSTHIPNSELDIFVFYSLYVETNGRNCSNNFTKPAEVSNIRQIGDVKPYFNLYRIVVFPAASRPTMRIRISFFPKNLSKSFEIVRPMIACRKEARYEWKGTGSSETGQWEADLVIESIRTSMAHRPEQKML